MKKLLLEILALLLKNNKKIIKKSRKIRKSSTFNLIPIEKDCDSIGVSNPRP